MGRHAKALVALLGAGGIWWAGTAQAQVFVYPRHADQNQVRYFDFDWRQIDVQVSPPGAKAAAVRLFFYERERQVAQRATASISSSYRYLVDAFDYTPAETFPYILYNSYQEFLETNLFPLQEGVLGVTSPKDLKLTLSYFGDHRMFELVSTHEMAHQFTIQKVRSMTAKAGRTGDSLDGLPLWFVEGLAEYYAQRGIDPEAEMLVRDLLVNPDLLEGYAFLDFFEDRAYSFLWTYKVGQVRCAFLEETYGKGTLQRILTESTSLLTGGPPSRNNSNDFPHLLERLTGDGPRVLAARFESWLKRRAYRTYLDSGQDTPSLRRLPELKDPADALASAPDGNLLLYRTVSQDTGQSRLVLVDTRSPETRVNVVYDDQPGTESLHMGFGRNFDLASSALVYTVQVYGHDVLRWAPVGITTRREATSGPRSKIVTRKVLSVGAAREYALSEHGLVAAYSPTLSPDGQRVAFVGLDAAGQRDLYVLQPTNKGFKLTRLTQDVYGERQVSWGPAGIVFTSDATGHGKYNLFRVQPDRPGEVERLTTEPRDELDPRVFPDGRIFFVAYEGGRADVHELVDHHVTRRTDIATGLFDIAPGPDGGAWALFHHSGTRRPVLIERRSLLSVEHQEQPDAEPPRLLGEHTLDTAVPYRLMTRDSWEIAGVSGLLGGGGQGLFGQVFAAATDRLRNHAVMLNLALLGSVERSSGQLFYINQEHRLTFGGGPFQAFRYRIDRTFGNTPWLLPSYERFYGLQSTTRYPFDRFFYVQGDLAAGGTYYFTSPEQRLFLALPEANGMGDLLAAWYAANGSRFQMEATVRFGFDTLRHNPLVGPLSGSSVLLELGGTYQPTERQLFGSARVDAEQHFPLFARSQLLARVGAGISGGGPLAHQFYLSSFDTLRGVPFGTTSWLIGTHFLFSTAELRIPLDAMVQIPFITHIEAIAGGDFGGVGDSFDGLWRHRVLDGVLGLNFAVGPFLFRLHFAKPIDVGLDDALGQPIYPNGTGNWVTNFSLGIVGLPGFARIMPGMQPALR